MMQEDLLKKKFLLKKKILLEKKKSLLQNENTPESVSLSLVDVDGDLLRHVKNQTEKICMAAVTNTPSEIFYVKNQTKELCIKAVSADGDCLNYVVNQDFEIIMEAIKQNIFSIYYISIILTENQVKIVEDYANNYFSREKSKEKAILNKVYKEDKEVTLEKIEELKENAIKDSKLSNFI